MKSTANLAATCLASGMLMCSWSPQRDSNSQYYVPNVGCCLVTLQGEKKSCCSERPQESSRNQTYYTCLAGESLIHSRLLSHNTNLETGLHNASRNRTVGLTQQADPTTSHPLNEPIEVRSWSSGTYCAGEHTKKNKPLYGWFVFSRRVTYQSSCSAVLRLWQFAQRI